MDEGGVKAWGPHQVQNPLAFSDEEEEDLLDFMYKFKAPRKTEFPLEVHGIGGCGVERVFTQRALPWRSGLLGVASLGIPSISWRRGDLPPANRQEQPLGSL